MNAVPVLLATPAGELRPVPAELDDVLRCPACGAALVRAQQSWVCPAGFHGRAVPDEHLVELIELRLREARSRYRSGRRMVTFLRRRAKWVEKNGGGKARAGRPRSRR